MRRIAHLATTLLLIVGLGAHADPGEDFTALLHDAWQWRLNENPVMASRLGDRRKNDQWGDLSLAAVERRHEDERFFLRRLGIIVSSRLSDYDQLF